MPPNPYQRDRNPPSFPLAAHSHLRLLPLHISAFEPAKPLLFVYFSIFVLCPISFPPISLPHFPASGSRSLCPISFSPISLFRSLVSNSPCSQPRSLPHRAVAATAERKALWSIVEDVEALAVIVDSLVAPASLTVCFFRFLEYCSIS